MGNLCASFERKPLPVKQRSRRRSSNVEQGPKSSKRSSRTRLSRNKFDDSMLQEHALAAAILFRQHQRDGGALFRFHRSVPNSTGPKKGQYLPSSSSSRAWSSADPLFQPHQLVNQEIKHDDLETNHFVLVHGGGFGAWCWYKTIALLEEGGFKVTAIDLTGSGIHSFDPNGITSLAQYVKPITDFLEKHADGEKVILVGHDFGGTCISYAMEMFPSRIAKAVFIAATMMTNGQSALDMFSQQSGSIDLMQRARSFLYANGNDHPPTAVEIDKSLSGDLLFNLSPSKDVALASALMRQIPFAPVSEKLSLSEMKYGSVRRFYIETLQDNAIPITLQESMINSSPPEKVFCLKGADHSPFFSKPQSLHKLLVEISKIPST